MTTTYFGDVYSRNAPPDDGLGGTGPKHPKGCRGKPQPQAHTMTAWYMTAVQTV